MSNNNSKQISFLKNFGKGIIRVLKIIQNILNDFSQEYPRLSEIIQLSFIYYFAVVDLLYAILSNVFALGYFPEVLREFYPPIKAILSNPLFQMWNSPEKIFFLSYLAIEVIVVRSVFKFSKVVKYNILLIFAILMIQGLVISYWDLLFHRQIASPVAKWAYDQGALIHTNKDLAITFFLNTFIIFILAYIYLYWKAIQGVFATLPGMNWLSDSIAFWLRIKTPTMRFGKRGKEKKK